MVRIKFIASFANKVIGDKILVDGQLASQLISEGVAVLDPVKSEAATILSNK